MIDFGMSRNRGKVNLSTALLLLLLTSGCGDNSVSLPGSNSADAGPEIRLRLVTAPELLLQFDRDVAVVREDDRSLVYAGPLPRPFLVRSLGNVFELNGHRIDFSVRIREIQASDEAASAGLGANSKPAASAWLGDPPAAPTDGDATFVIAKPGAAPLRYRGAVELHLGGQGIKAVNALKLEHYLAGVIAAEMLGSWSIEALKAQAVASRSYAFYELSLDEENDRNRIFESTPVFQRYRGVAAESAKVARALVETRGQILTYQGRVFRSYFHSTCGGQTGNAESQFGDAAIPPLAGTSCGKCEDSPRFSWTKSMSAGLVRAAVSDRGEVTGGVGPVGPVQNIEVGEVGQDGRVRYVHIVHALGSLDWRADRFRREIEIRQPDTLWSNDFKVQSSNEPDKFLVEGRGFGHGVGLCQYGAQGFAKDGDTYQKILGRYYPHSEIRQAYAGNAEK